MGEVPKNLDEHYLFSGEMRSSEKLELTEDEVDIITKLGLSEEDLARLLSREHFSEGSYALLFNVPESDPRLVAKVWKNPKYDSGRALNENVALRLLRIRDYESAPKSKGYLKPSKILFEEKIEGAPVEEFDENVIERLAIALANLHSIKLNKYGYPLSERKKGTRMDSLHDSTEALRSLASSFTDQNEEITLIRRSLDEMERRAREMDDEFSEDNFTIIHFDLNKANIIYSRENGNLTIVDWEQASAGDNAMDVAKLFLSQTLIPTKNEFFWNNIKVIYQKRPTLRRPTQSI